MTRPDETWMHQGLCRAENPDLFFPEGQANQHSIKQVKAICRRCPVTEHCLQFALGSDVEGIWGGTSWRERNQLRRRLGLPRRPGVRGDKFKREHPSAA